MKRPGSRREVRGGCGRPRLVGGLAVLAVLVACSAWAQAEQPPGWARIILGAYAEYIPTLLAGAGAGFGAYLKSAEPFSMRRFGASLLVGSGAGVVALGLGLLIGSVFGIDSPGFYAVAGVALPIAGGWAHHGLLSATQRGIPEIADAGTRAIRRRMRVDRDPPEDTP